MESHRSLLRLIIKSDHRLAEKLAARLLVEELGPIQIVTLRRKLVIV
jgi:hypothetical protein